MSNQQFPTYTFNKEKAIEVILYLANKGNADVYHIVKAILYADIYHINKYYRPVLGDNYKKEKHGPLPIGTHRLMGKILLGERPFQRQGDNIKGLRAHDPDELSKSDIEALEYGWDHVKGRGFTDLEEEAHKLDAYKNSNGKINYRDFISTDNRENAEEIFCESASIVF